MPVAVRMRVACVPCAPRIASSTPPTSASNGSVISAERPGIQICANSINARSAARAHSFAMRREGSVIQGVDRSVETPYDHVLAAER